MSVIPQGGPPSKAGQPRIRPASLADVPDLVALMGAFYAESGYPLPVSQATRTFERLLSQPAHGAVWLMVADEQPAGFVVLTVASEALSVVRQTCEERGVRALLVETSLANEQAVRVYRRAGFTETGRLLLSMPLATPVHEADRNA